MKNHNNPCIITSELVPNNKSREETLTSTKKFNHDEENMSTKTETFPLPSPEMQHIYK